MKLYITKHILLFIIGLFALQTLSAQITKTDYFMKTSFLRNYHNPALRPDQGQLIVPFLPSVGASATTNTFNLDHFTSKHNGQIVNFLHPSVSPDQFLKGLSKDNFVSSDASIRLFGLGLFNNDKFWNLEMGVRAHVDANIPKSMAELIKVGFDQNRETTYDLKNLSATGNAFVEIGLSHSRPLLDNTLMIGARAKLLIGAGFFDLNVESLDITAGPEQWRALSRVTLNASAPGIAPKYDDKGLLDGFDFGWQGIPGYGTAFDLGAVYHMYKLHPALHGLKISGSLNDIGFIRWNANNSMRLESPTTETIINPNLPNKNSIDGNSLSNIFDDAFDDIKNAINLNRMQRARHQTVMLRMNMNMAAEYEFIRSKLSAGAVYSMRFGNYFTSKELTVIGNYRPKHWLSTSLSYSFLHSDFRTFGMAVHLAPRKGITFLLASDYIIPHVSPQFIPTTSKGINIQVGFSIPIGRVTTAKL